MFIRSYQQRYGFPAYEFTDPVQALEYFYERTEGNNLVLSDIRMPQMNGYEFVINIKTLKPKIKIILMSAFEIREGELSRVLSSIKIDGLISKSLSLKSVVEIIKKYNMKYDKKSLCVLSVLRKYGFEIRLNFNYG